MKPMQIEVDNKQVLDLLARLQRKVTDMRSIMHEIGLEVVHSVEENFAAEGRYSVVGSYLGGDTKWQPLSPTTLKIKKAKGKKGPHKILQEDGHLARSISSAAIATSANSVTVGTNVSYAAMHQFGATKGEYGTAMQFVKEHQRTTKKGDTRPVRAHQRRVPNPMFNIPARPFLTLHPDNLLNIIDTLTDYLLDDI